MVFAIFKALDEEEKKEFVSLINKEGIKPKKRKYPKIYYKLPAKFHPVNMEMLVAKIMSE